MDFATTGRTILEVFGAIAIIGGGFSWVFKMFDPFKKLKARVDSHQKMLENDKEVLDRIEAAVGRIERQNGIQSWALLETINHLITGNDIEKLKERRDAMLENLTQLRSEHE